jgi:feruloyl esterase
MARLWLVLFLALAAPTAAAPPDCEALATLSLEHATFTARHMSGPFKLESGRTVTVTTAFCRVVGVIKPSADSHIRFEVWMPATGWNGKFQGVGNGGYAGSVSYGELVAALAGGYATASTDTGHADGNSVDATWALGHPEKVIDFGYRAIHETAVKAKALITAYYGEGPKRSYFAACSNGGRQALMEAQRFPEDYDGIIAGAPANQWTRLLSFAGEIVRAASQPGAYLPASKLPAIQAAAVAACDADDGVKDGIVDTPSRCRVDPKTLLCKGTESDACLTAPQVATLTLIHDGARTAGGLPFSPGYSPSGEAAAGGWAEWITGETMESALLFGFSTQFFTNIVHADPAWSYRTFNLDRDSKAAVEKAAHTLDATDADLSRFRAHGGKLILYHGWNDAAIPALHVVEYYQKVGATLGAEQTDSFVRLFMVPGMQHCGGGAGPDTFGQNRPGVNDDPLHDIDAALERWVEQGVAPEKLIATKYKEGAPSASGVSVTRTRPLCPYPQVAKWTGSGSTDDAANFVCAALLSR